MSKCSQCKTVKLKEELFYSSLKPYCSPECGAKLALKLYSKKKKQEEKAYDDKTRALKKTFNSNDLAHQRKLTQKAFNKMRVLEELQWFESRGLQPKCISCSGELGNDQRSCGHFKTRGAQGNLR